jgi:hypothetical protein
MRSRNVIVIAAVSVLCVGCGSHAPASSPTSPTSGAIFRQGTLTIRQTFVADLDAGMIVSNPTGPSDVWFEAQTATAWFFTSTGAVMAIAGTSEPGFSGCKSASVSVARIPMATLTTGLYLCGRTDQGRVFEMRVVDLPVPQPAGTDPTLTVAFTTFTN